jgi:ribonuclease Y
LVRKIIAEAKITNAEELAKKLIADAEKEAETLKKEQLLEARKIVGLLQR